jgi:uncharacterized membrane protein YcaP (DUF421 family)
MDFFQGQESLTAIQWALRAITGFLFLILVSKVMGHRSFSQLRLLDFIMAISIGNIIAHPLSDEGLGLKGSLITMSTLVILYLLGLFISLKSVKLRNFLDPKPTPIIKNGNILYKNLSKARLTIDILLSEMRKGQIEDVQKVALALWEPDGTISFFKDTQYQSLSPSDMKMPVKPFDLPKTIIKEGQFDTEELSQTGKDEKWVVGQIKSIYDLDISEILLATIDSQEKIKVFMYK